jgi:hypothetical protein
VVHIRRLGIYVGGGSVAGGLGGLPGGRGRFDVVFQAFHDALRCRRLIPEDGRDAGPQIVQRSGEPGLDN